jgi:uncharacterized membrane protein
MVATPSRQYSNTGSSSRAAFDIREWSENGGSGTNGASPGLAAKDVAAMAKALGWLGLGLGLAQVAMPRRVANLIGLPGDEDDQKVVRVVGLREIATGLGILAQARPTPWLWSRVGGDAMDLALLRAAMDSPWARKDRVTAATLAVLGVTAADLLCSTKLTAEPAPRSEAIESNDVHVMAAVTVQAPVSEIFAVWDGFQGLPRFMTDAATVQITGDRQSRWTIPGPAGTSLEWDVQITATKPNEQITWRATEGGLFSAQGTMRFRTAPGNRGTQVIFDAHFSPPGGALGKTIAQPLAEVLNVKIANDLRRFKQLIELGEVAHSDDSIVPGPNPAQPRPRTPSGAPQTIAA